MLTYCNGIPQGQAIMVSAPTVCVAQKTTADLINYLVNTDKRFPSYPKETHLVQSLHYYRTE